MRIAVIDDEAEERNILREYILRYAEENGGRFEPLLFASGDEFLRSQDQDIDIFFLDIEMPGTNGMDTARAIRRSDSGAVLLFVTNIAQFAMNGYEVEALDYVLKPIGYVDFSLKLAKAIRRAGRDRRHYVLLETKEGMEKIAADELLFVEVMGHYVRYHTKKGTVEIRGSMKEQEEKLAGLGFTRTHKSFLANVRYIEGIRQTELTLAGTPLPLGRVYRESVMRDFMKYMRS